MEFLQKFIFNFLPSQVLGVLQAKAKSNLLTLFTFKKISAKVIVNVNLANAICPLMS